MIVLDTRTDSKYRGNIQVAIDMLIAGKCDDIITRGADFVCIRYKNQKQGITARKRALEHLKTSEVRYVIVARADDEPALCISRNLAFSVDFAHAIFYKTREDANKVISKISAPQGYTLTIESYLYRTGNNCRLRIYYEVHGLLTDRGTLSFIRNRVADGTLIARYDRHDKKYVMLDDLLIFKDQLVTLVSSTGITYKRVFDLKLLLHDGLIAFDAVSKFVEKHPEQHIPNIKYLTLNNNDASRRDFYDIGAVIYSDKAVRELAEKELGLSDWFSKSF